MQLSLENISLKLGAKQILREIDLQVEDGALISLLGASGCGKTTLLKTIAGILRPDSGSVYLDGRCADKLPPHKRGAVIVFQDFRLFPHMTVAENIGFALRMRGVGQAERNRIAAELLEQVQLPGFAERKVQQMSGGQIQRVALARALAANPNVLLLDEPFSSLDENLRQDMRQLVLQLQREYRITTILVTHDCQEALAMSDKIALMMDGRILQYAAPQQIYDLPSSPAVADFFGDTVYIPGIVKDNYFTSKEAGFAVALPDGNYRAMFRAQAAGIILGPGAASGDYIVAETYYRGSETALVLKSTSGGLTFTLTAAAPCQLRAGERVDVSWDSAKAVLFPD